MNSSRPPSNKEVERFIKKNDKSHDGKVSKMEMFVLLKASLNR
jgi:Ca2+-binding EF-hand superfamily protein